MNSVEKLLLGCVLGATATAIIMFVYIPIDNHMMADKYTKEDLQWYRDTIKCIQGGTVLYSPKDKKYIQKDSDDYDWFNYKYCSFDKGETWYAIDIYGIDYDGFKIIGRVENVFPGLIKQRKYLDELYDE